MELSGKIIGSSNLECWRQDIFVISSVFVLFVCFLGGHGEQIEDEIPVD